MFTHQPMAHLLCVRAEASVRVLGVDALQPPSFPLSCSLSLNKNSPCQRAPLYFLWIITLKKPLVSRSPLVSILPIEIPTVRFYFCVSWVLLLVIAMFTCVSFKRLQLLVIKLFISIFIILLLLHETIITALWMPMEQE